MHIIQHMPENPIWERAMDLHERVRACPSDVEIKAEIARWRAEDPTHERAWVRVNRVWELSGECSPNHPLHLPANSETIGSRRWSGLAGAIAASVALVLALPEVVLDSRADYTTGTAVTKTIVLADGSKVVLAPQSALAVHYSQVRRQITLLRGKAFFDVVHNASAPFTVRAGKDQVSDLGTAFDVSEGRNAVKVSVARGAVQVTRDGRMLAPILRAGEELRAPLNEQNMEIRRVDSDQPGNWRYGRLLADNMPISDLLDEVGRNYTGTIVLRRPDLGEKRVTGIFDLSNPEAALASAARPFGVKVRHVTPWLLVVG